MPYEHNRQKQYEVKDIQPAGVIFQHSVIKGQRRRHQHHTKKHKQALALHMPGLAGADGKGVSRAVNKAQAAAHQHDDGAKQPPIQIF